MPVDESMYDWFTSIMTCRERLMREIISRMLVVGCKESFADTTKKYPLKILKTASESQALKIWRAKRS